MSNLVHHLDLYRLPWSLTDNAISWLEPTAQCNLACDGCYRRNRVEHKTFQQAVDEMDVFARQRRSDALSIAGGDPLLYPDLVRIVGEARRRGLKPIVNTNGKALTAEMLRDLRRAGLAGITFHVDSKQGRPGKWRGKDEIELCALRDELAEMAASAGVGVAFNATIYPDTLDAVGPLARWAERRMDLVDVMVFILYRDMPAARYRYFAGDREVSVSADASGQSDSPVYNTDVARGYPRYPTADDIIAALRREYPGFMPAAYLNGTVDPSSFKWLLAGRVGRPGETYGFVGPKFMEIVQTGHHMLTGRYLAYAAPTLTRRAEPALLLAPFDAGLRGIALQALRAAARAPLSALRRRLCYQSLVVIQPIDVLPDGRMNMCDGCPDMTVWNGQLVWSCRMDEQERFGRNLSAIPRPPRDDSATPETISSTARAPAR